MIENSILSNLMMNEGYARNVLPFIKTEYFSTESHKKHFDLIVDHVNRYHGLPSKEALLVTLENETVDEKTYDEIKTSIEEAKIDKDTNQEWLVDETEKFCQDKALHNALRKSIVIAADGEKGISKGAIPELLSEALAVSFDTNIGHDFLEDYAERFDFYHRVEEKIPFDIDMLNKITKGGIAKKSLAVLMATTGGGKTLAKCHMAAANLMQGLKVLYITNEMAEERIAERIDANILDIPLDALQTLDRKTYDKKIDRVRSLTNGKLIIKEYPTATAGAAHFKHLLRELRLKKKFVPDVIYIDYLNICVSTRYKSAGDANSYLYIKAIAEELRGLAVEFNVPVITSTQANRSGYGNSDMDMTSTSESIGLPMTVDFMLGLISTEELESLGQLLMKQLKNRFGDITVYNKFVVGIDRSKMRLYNVEHSAQTIMSRAEDDEKIAPAKPKINFEGFK